MAELKTTIGLEIHVQLKTKSKMFCRCDNEAHGIKPNTTVCPVCLGMPGVLPVANEQAVLWTIKTGLALNCTIPKIAKFDRKHYFYPDLPKGYQISQYDEPFCSGGYIETDGVKVRLNRIHLEEDAGKLIHSDGKSLVDLNRAGTPLMEIVTEPDITSPEQAGDFLRKLQKIVRDEVSVSEASMEKGHMRCDANISVTDGEKMSEIVELKNLNSFKFVEKALTLEESRLKEEYPDWSKGKKVTRGYDSKKNETFAQRQKEEASDYRYFPEPDLPPFDSSEIDLDGLKNEIGKSHEVKIEELISDGVREDTAKILIKNIKKRELYDAVSLHNDESNKNLNAFLALNIVHRFVFDITDDDIIAGKEYFNALKDHFYRELGQNDYVSVIKMIHEKNYSYAEARNKSAEGSVDNSKVENIISEILHSNAKEVEAYKAGKTALFGFFMGEVMKRTQGKADPGVVRKILTEKLEK